MAMELDVLVFEFRGRDGVNDNLWLVSSRNNYSSHKSQTWFKRQQNTFVF